MPVHIAERTKEQGGRGFGLEVFLWRNIIRITTLFAVVWPIGKGERGSVCGGGGGEGAGRGGGREGKGKE